MEPKAQECMGLYLYGSGYYAREDRQLGILRGERADAAFCAGCPGKRACETEHARRVTSSKPAEVEQFEREVREANKRGMSRNLLAVAKMKVGQPDPYMALALENYQRGVREREHVDDS